MITEIGCDYDYYTTMNKATFFIPNNVNSGEYNYITSSNNINNAIIRPQNTNFAQLSIEVRDEDDFFVELNGVDYILMLELE